MEEKINKIKNKKSKLTANFTWVPIETPDAEFRLHTFWRLLAEMVISQMVEGTEDNEQAQSTKKVGFSDTNKTGLQEGDGESNNP